MDDQNPLRNYTIIGRLWIIACLTGGMFVFIAYLSDTLPILPAGSYPVFLFLFPVVLGMLAIYVVGVGVFKLFGVNHRKPPEPPDTL